MVSNRDLSTVFDSEVYNLLNLESFSVGYLGGLYLGEIGYSKPIIDKMCESFKSVKHHINYNYDHIIITVTSISKDQLPFFPPVL